MTDNSVEWERMSLLDSKFGRTSPEPSAAPEAKTSRRSSRKLPAWQTKGFPTFLFLSRKSGETPEPSLAWVRTDARSVLHGEFTTPSSGAYLSAEDGYVYLPTGEERPPHGSYWTLNITERPRIPRPTKLSQILETNPDPKYRLSRKACQGILNRAERRGKELPKELKAALTAQATPSRSGGGIERDSNGRKAGKGALVQTEKSATLGVSQDQTLIQTGTSSAVSISAKQYFEAETEVASSLLATDYKEPQAVAYGIDHAITTGGNCTAQGPCVYEEIEGTMKAAGPHAVAYGISAYESNAMKSPNPHSGVYEADTARTLDLNGGSPACNQGGIAITQVVDMGGGKSAANTQTYALQGSMIGRSDKNGPQGDGVNEDVSFTLNTIDRHAVVETEAQAIDVYNQSIDGDIASTLTSAAGGTNTSGPKILSAGFKPRQGVAAKGLGYEAEKAPTLSTDENFAAVVTEVKDELADWLS